MSSSIFLNCEKSAEHSSGFHLHGDTTQWLGCATFRSYAYSGLTALAKDHDHEPRPTPPDNAEEWLGLVHLVISDFKCSLIGTFHVVFQKHL